MSDTLTVIREQIAKGHIIRARRILRILLEEPPTAPLWYLASKPCETPKQEMGCLRQALKIDPRHLQARERYIELKNAPREDIMPPLVVLVEDLPEPGAVPLLEPDPFTAKHLRHKQSRRHWTMVSLTASLIMSLSSTYFLLTVLGSPIPAQIR